MRVKATVALVLAVSLLTVMHAAASTTRSVAIVEFGDYDNCCWSEFSPVNVLADPGDTIELGASRWTHRYVGFAGASFDSGNTTGPYSLPYTGGEVRYRCTLHSTLIESADVCIGMCGAVNDFTPPPPPLIESPASGSALENGYRVLIKGTAHGAKWADISVDGKLVHRELVTLNSEDLPFYEIGFNLPNGTHRIDVVGVDYAGNRSDITSSQITVEDVSPAASPAFDEQEALWVPRWNVPGQYLSGVAPEAAKVRIWDGDLLIGEIDQPGLDLDGFGSSGNWSFNLPEMEEGRHFIGVSGVDPAGNESSRTIREVIFDYTTPSATFDTPSDGQNIIAPDGKVGLSGSITDERVAGEVRMTFRRVLAHPQYDILLKTSFLQAECPGCGTVSTSRWSATPTLPAGTYRVDVVVTDLAGNWVALPRRSFTVVSLAT